MNKGLILLILLSAAACGPKGDGVSNNGASNNGGSSNNGVSNNGTTPNNGTMQNNGTTAPNNGTTSGNNGTTTPMGLVWDKVVAPCPGSRTASVLFLNDTRGLLGCGENADGEGLFQTKDGGRTWTEIRDFADLRVLDIREYNGDVFVAGADNLGGTRESVWKLDAEMKIASALYTASNQIGSVQQAENIAIGEDGRAIIDSLTGTGVAVRGPGEQNFVEVDTLSEMAIDGMARGFQMRRIDFLNNKIYATGSLINDNPRVYLSSKKEGATYHVTKVDLSNKDAEMLDLHVFNDSLMVVAGFSQQGTATNRSPLIFRGEGDLYDAANWSEVDVFGQGIEFAGGIRAISVAGTDILAVGEKFPTSKGGFALFSQDEGKTWTDITPEDKIGPLSEAWLWNDGSAFIAGGQGLAFKVSGLK